MLEDLRRGWAVGVEGIVEERLDDCSAMRVEGTEVLLAKWGDFSMRQDTSIHKCSVSFIIADSKQSMKSLTQKKTIGYEQGQCDDLLVSIRCSYGVA